MLARILDTLCVHTLSSATFGRVVRAVIVLASRDASHYREAATGAGTMIPVP
ncbi:hypothetical protein MKK58_22650 [Methylobacterium sp. J-078]|jgi:hypothetical protein|uniref:hypothetical protein n=1 Tax=Methylobacterium sp. J-078 TaxID=2836657 RepID=UPI001FB9986F|nr:hypothetical protein [Methylobacterium sp. J-078]MCJ2047315.1 hypothetical protein [Methylobacterium sp. J-078]